MKKFIDLKDQTGNIDYNKGEREFAFYCTIVDRFETFNGNQTWTCRIDFESDIKSDGKENILNRFLKLIPKEIE